MGDFLSLSPEVQKEIHDLGSVDLLIGIPSYNSAQSIGKVLETANAGLRQFFPRDRSLIVIPEGGSSDETISVINRARGSSIPNLIIPYLADSSRRFALPFHGIPEREKALWAILHTAERLQAKACAIVNSRLLSISPEWIESLFTPIYKLEFDYVSPIYVRHKYEGALVNCIVYPLVRALYRKGIRHPMSGEFGMSRRLINHFLSQELWSYHGDLPEIDMQMAVAAILTDYPICQVNLGPRLYEGPAGDLSSILSQVVGSLFQIIESHQGFWQKAITESHPPVFGTTAPQPPVPPSLDPQPMIEAFHRGLRDLLPLWEQALSPETLQDLYPLGGLGISDFRFPMDLWVRVIYDMLLAFHYRIFYWRHLLKSLVPLYLGRVASMIMETQKGSEAEAEESVQLLCQQFIAMRPYLVERWR